MNSIREIKIISVIGARPQFIKAAALCRAVDAYNAEKRPRLRHILLHTGQHYDQNMSDLFFNELNIPRPEYNLGIGSAAHGMQTGRMLAMTENVLVKEKPDWVVVYGDTNSTLAGALAAAKMHIPVAHVEGGLRSFNRRMPEEINRVLTDHVSSLIFCPTETAVKNLAAEGITSGVKLVGDIMYDCSMYYFGKALPRESKILGELNLDRKSYYLATVHRPENTDNPESLKNIFEAFNAISSSDCPVVFPLHPRTRDKISEIDFDIAKEVLIVPPVSYMEMIILERSARIILTDSGGVQKESYFFKVPCVTLRQETEWIETLSHGANILSGADSKKITEAVEAFNNNPQVQFDDGLYGSGNASLLILNNMLERTGKTKLE